MGGYRMSCAFEPCADVALELCGLPGGCILARFGPAPRAKPRTAVRRRQRPQERLFGEAVRKGSRKRERSGVGRPRPDMDLGQGGGV